MLAPVMQEWKEHVLEIAADRSELRLAQETSGLRVQMSQMHASLIRWMFVFWLGQLGVTLTVIGIILNAVDLL